MEVAYINIYKIPKDNADELIQYLKQEYLFRGNKTEIYNRHNGETGKVQKIKYQMSLYYSSSESPLDLKWNWVLHMFGQQSEEILRSPKCVVFLNNGVNQYALTFGHSYYKVDQYSDKNWAFAYARTLEYENIKTTALTNPNSQRNKTVNTYLDYESLDFDSGEALTKLKAKISLPDGFKLFSKTIEFGNSIRFSVKDPTLLKVVEIIEYVENSIQTKDPRIKIPYFHAIKDPRTIDELTTILKNQASEDLFAIDFSEYQIYATRIVFSENHEFQYMYKKYFARVDNISQESLSEFIKQNCIDIRTALPDIKVIVYEDGISKFSTVIYKLIFYTNEEKKALLMDGVWYFYNDDYLQYLNDSLAEIPVFYERAFDYSKKLHMAFLKERYHAEKKDEKYSNLSAGDIWNKIKDKYYRENYYNRFLSEQGYANYDRDLEKIGKHKIEIMDLYKDQTMYSVKFGNASSKLSYSVDQSLKAIKAYHKKEISFDSEINTVCLWLVLDRKRELQLLNGVPDINSLNMIILKNKLDQWKKSVRLMGYDPIIRINYVKD